MPNSMPNCLSLAAGRRRGSYTRIRRLIEPLAWRPAKAVHVSWQMVLV